MHILKGHFFDIFRRFKNLSSRLNMIIIFRPRDMI